METLIKRKRSHIELGLILTLIALILGVLEIPAEIPLRNVELALLVTFALCIAIVIYLTRRGSHVPSQTDDLITLLDQAGIGPTRRLRAFLNSIPDRENRAGLAIDDHVLHLWDNEL